MCELLAASGKGELTLNLYLKEFASHSKDHPHGWGIATFYGNAVSLEKEPIAAYQSGYLKQRLRHRFVAKDMMAHIRLATKGNMVYENCHPFVQRDKSGRAWTLMHNGTIFESPILDPYIHVQEGLTDSERILCHVIARINALYDELGREPNEKERFEELDRIVLDITPHNKVNLIIYDSDRFYIHTNMRNTLYMTMDHGSRIFSTTQLEGAVWTPVPFMQLISCKAGDIMQYGTRHENEYIYSPEHMKDLFLDYIEV